MGHGRFIAFYLLCGLAAAALQVFANPASGIPMVGPPCDRRVMGAYVLLYPKVQVKMLLFLGVFVTTFSIPPSGCSATGSWRRSSAASAPSVRMAAASHSGRTWAASSPARCSCCCSAIPSWSRDTRTTAGRRRSAPACNRIVRFRGRRLRGETTHRRRASGFLCRRGSHVAEHQDREGDGNEHRAPERRAEERQPDQVQVGCQQQRDEQPVTTRGDDPQYAAPRRAAGCAPFQIIMPTSSSAITMKNAAVCQVQASSPVHSPSRSDSSPPSLRRGPGRSPWRCSCARSR